MRNLLIVLLAIAVVAAGFFLPGMLLERSGESRIEMNYQKVAVTSEQSSDYAWRMERIGDYYFGDDPQLLTTYISVEADSEEMRLARQRFRESFTELTWRNVISAQLQEAIEEAEEDGKSEIVFYYIFDSESLNGLKIAEYQIRADGWVLSAVMDMESGRVAKIVNKGKIPLKSEEVSGWSQVLRGFGDYLEIGDFGYKVPEDGMRELDFDPVAYYDRFTQESGTGLLSVSTGQWLELRLLQNENEYTVCVFRGGK